MTLGEIANAVAGFWVDETEFQHFQEANPEAHRHLQDFMLMFTGVAERNTDLICSFTIFGDMCVEKAAERLVNMDLEIIRERLERLSEDKRYRILGKMEQTKRGGHWLRWYEKGYLRESSEK